MEKHGFIFIVTEETTGNAGVQEITLKREQYGGNY